jgi:hypothetical protein
VVQSRKSHIQSQHHGQHELEHRHDAGRPKTIDAARYSSGDGARSASAADTDEALETQMHAEKVMAESLATAIKDCLDNSFLGRVTQMSGMLPFLFVLDTFEEVQKRGVVRASSAMSA